MGSYSLETNYRNNFNADNHNSNEMIFAVPSDGVRMQSYSAITVIMNGQVGNIEETNQANISLDRQLAKVINHPLRAIR
jgi:hypothetical protein